MPPDSYITSEANQPQTISASSMANAQFPNNNNNNYNRTNHHEAGGGASGMTSHAGHQHPMVNSHVFQPHTSNYHQSPYQNKTHSGPYNGGIMLEGGPHEKESVSIYVPSVFVGAIIGKSGSVIKEMISNSGSSIKVAAALPLVENLPKESTNSNSTPSPPHAQNDCNSNDKVAPTEDKSQPESEKESRSDTPKTVKSRFPQNAPNVGPHVRRVTITGPQESNWCAQWMIYRKVALESGMGNDVSLTAEIQIPTHLAGRIIGKSGATIKRIQKHTKTVIKLIDCRPQEVSIDDGDQQQQAADTRVQITGDFNGSHIAQRQIRALISEGLFSTKSKSSYFQDHSIPLNAMNQPSYLFNNIPLPYMPGPNAQYPIAPSIVNSHTSHPGHHAIPRTMSNGLHHGAGAQPYLDPMFQDNYTPLYPNKPATPGFMLDNSLEKQTVSIYVPNSMVGAIIGKSGSAIKEMISNSGASIKVATAMPLVENSPKESDSNLSPMPAQDQVEDKTSQPESEQESQSDASKTKPKSTKHPLNSLSSNSNIRRVTIIGTPSSQWCAQYMIYRKVALETMGSDVSLTAEIQIPSQLAGKIIGKSGNTIKRLQKQTRTVIRLTDSRPPSLSSSSTATASAAENNNNEDDNENKSEIDRNEGDSMENESEKEEPKQEQQPQQSPVDSCVQITGDFNGSQLAQRQIRNLIKQSVPFRVEVRLLPKS